MICGHEMHGYPWRTHGVVLVMACVFKGDPTPSPVVMERLPIQI